ncbi:uncharacterized protein F4822DRAFT_384178 [Hypoxylon trugodes]|uniref:uncharacterized protein n=1 Tax=Hypoxylon trugodes TaxID=326681 RepID=UPI002191DA73|nr:uncharacterized protein F4822DRAFT_384178 [Hypoxylon trugodes]KAI1393288.1 hypothetical protein F4822DRAFT_384178 [Hypoxylon trugodes]
MAPGQNTFSIIPNAPCAINGNSDASASRSTIRPMTTKQAKKAYSTANKGPKLSKAERRRQELFEQDRIRKEFEKEKNQARAKAARDKKKEKEEKERAEKKKKGLPLVDVHPSQDTISWFVRGDRKKKQGSPAVSLSAVNRDDSDSSCALSARGDSEPPLKKQKTASPEPKCSPSPPNAIDDSTVTAPDFNVGEASPEVDGPIPLEQNATPDRPSAHQDDPDMTESLHDDDILNELIEVASSPLVNTTTAVDMKCSRLKDEAIPSTQLPLKPSDCPSHLPTSTKKLSQKQKAEDSASPPSVQCPLQPLNTSRINSRLNNPPKEPIPDQAKPPAPVHTSMVDSPKQSEVLQQSVSTSRAFRHPITPMGPPPVPPKFRPRNHVSTKGLKTPPFLHKQTPKSNVNHAAQETPEEQLPTSTQLFMLGHLDDFFPSPSQEVRELFGESKPGTGANSEGPKPKNPHSIRLPPNRRLPTKSILTASNTSPLAPAIKESKLRKGPSPKEKPCIQMRELPSPTVANPQSSDQSDAFDMPFFSTQDFFLSSQDMKDIEEETTSPTGLKWGRINPQYKELPPEHGFSSLQATRNITSTESTTLTSKSAPRQVKGPESIVRSRLTNDKDLSTHSQLPSKPTERFESSTPASAQLRGNHSRKYDLGIEHRPPEKLGNGKSTTNQGPQNKALRTSQAKDSVIPQRNSPKSFFAASGKEAHYKYAIERRKTIAWESVSTRQKVRDELEDIQKSEDERLDKLLLEAEAEIVHTRMGDTRISSSSPKANEAGSQRCNQSQPRSINQLSNSAEKNAQSQRISPPNEERQRPKQTRSSYEMMLKMLGSDEQKKNQNQKQEQHAIPASQETDYGEIGLDDFLSEML